MNNKSTGSSLATVLGIVFIILKLTGTITWSWWWVLAPFWMPMVFVAVILIILAIVVAINKNL